METASGSDSSVPREGSLRQPSAGIVCGSGAQHAPEDEFTLGCSQTTRNSVWQRFVEGPGTPTCAGGAEQPPRKGRTLLQQPAHLGCPKTDYFDTQEEKPLPFLSVFARCVVTLGWYPQHPSPVAPVFVASVACEWPLYHRELHAPYSIILIGVCGRGTPALCYTQLYTTVPPVHARKFCFPGKPGGRDGL